MIPLARTVAQLEPMLPRDLVSADAAAAIRDTARWLPAALTRRLYFECRLADASPQVNLIVALDAVERATLIGEREWQHGLAQVAPWPGVFEFGRRWADQQGDCCSRSQTCWLEFDVSPARTGAHQVPVPGVFLTRPGVGADDAGKLDEQLEALEVIGDAAVPPATARACREALACLPASARLTHVGILYSRDPNAVRLCVGPAGGQACTRWLAAIGWPGDCQTVTATLTALACQTLPDPLANVTLAHIDVCAGRVMPRLGLELAFADDAQRRGVTRETDLLDRLCALGFAVRAKVAAAAEWPGADRMWLAHQQAMHPVVRRLSNLKLVWNGDARPEVKVYLSAFHR